MHFSDRRFCSTQISAQQPTDIHNTYINIQHSPLRQRQRGSFLRASMVERTKLCQNKLFSIFKYLWSDGNSVKCELRGRFMIIYYYESKTCVGSVVVHVWEIGDREADDFRGGMSNKVYFCWRWREGTVQQDGLKSVQEPLNLLRVCYWNGGGATGKRLAVNPGLGE